MSLSTECAAALLSFRYASYKDVLEWLGPGQTDSQVGASSHKLNLRRDLRWVAKWTKSFLATTQKSQKKKHFKADISCISLADNRIMDVTQFALTWVGWPIGEKRASTCLQI